MKIGLVGYQGSGKSTLFEWLTGAAADPALAHRTQSAMATVPEPRVEGLCKVYNPKKITQAALEIVDTPGLDRSHEGSAQKLAMIREAGCLVLVVSSYDGNDPLADMRNFEEDLLIADLDVVSGRVERLRDQVKKPRPDRDALQTELKALEPLLETLESGKPLRDLELTPDQLRATRSFQLFSEKPRLVVINVADDADPGQYDPQIDGTAVMAVPLSLELGLTKMDDDERAEFVREMGIQPADRGALLRKIMEVSGQMLFFTAGEKEVRTWLIPRGSTAVEAAGKIHTDLARGFIRAETMKAEDLIRLGSEREVKANNLFRQEPKDYVIQDGDVLLIRHSG